MNKNIYIYAFLVRKLVKTRGLMSNTPNLVVGRQRTFRQALREHK